MIRALVAVLLATALLPARAEAVEGLAWRWPQGETRRFLLRTQLDLPTPLRMNARVNVDAEATRVVVSLVLSCTSAGSLGKKALDVRCGIDDAVVSATPTPNSRGRLAPVLREWSEALEAARLELVLGVNGRVRNVDLKGVDRSNDRLKVIAETQRTLVLRALAPLDVQLPKGGTDAGAGTWTQNESAWLGLVSVGTGTVGGGVVDHQVAAVNGSLVSLHQRGRGKVSTGQEYANQLRDFYALEVEGSAVFDTARGALIESQFLAVGQPTAGSIANDAGNAQPYAHAAVLQLLEPDRTPALGTPQELAP